MNTDPSTDVVRTYLSDYKPPPFLVLRVDLKFNLDTTLTVVDSELAVERNNGSDEIDFYLNGHNLGLLSIQIDGTHLCEGQYTLDDEGLTIHNPPDRFSLQIRSTTNPSENLALSGLYLSNDMLCTQCEAEGFRSITFFPDRPDILSIYKVHIESSRENYPVLLSNGELVATGNTANGRHYAIWSDPYPKPSYLFALVAGQLSVLEDQFMTNSGKSVKLEFYTDGDNLDKCVHAMNCLKSAMRWDEKVYGREYDLDRYMIVAVDHFNMGAMENKGLNIFNTKYVYAKPDTATDQDFQAVESVIAHEYFHNWSGNRVTLRDWFQLSLKEGFTIFRDQQFSADMGSRSVQRIRDVRMVKLHQFREDAGPSRHSVQPDSYLTIDNFYTITVYNKGAELIHMLFALIGAEKFRTGTDLYFDRHDGEAVTIDEFLGALQDASGFDLKQFRRWYKTAGTPIISVERHFDPTNHSYRLDFHQKPSSEKSQNGWQPMHIPIRCALFGSDGNRLDLNLDSQSRLADCDEVVLELKQEKQSFTFFDVSSEPVPSLLRGFSAPVVIDDPQSDSELFFTMANDDDAYCRWDACQRVSKLQINKLISQIQTGNTQKLDERYLAAIGEILRNPSIDPEFKSLLLEPPSEIAIAQTMDVVDPTAIHIARRQLIRTISSRYFNDFVSIYQDLRKNQSAGDGAGKRSLQNLCLNYLVELDSAQVHEIALKQFHTSKNMTDSEASLSALVRSSSKAKSAVLQTFYNRWRDDTGVIDKWFRIQAVVARSDTLDRVNELTQHESFTIQAPNRVYSLIGAFCNANPYCFHAEDGRGYELLADYVIQIDKSNPQSAARLAEAFSEIQRYDKKRQLAMHQKLQEIASVKSVSVNTFEIVDRILHSIKT